MKECLCRPPLSYPSIASLNDKRSRAEVKHTEKLCRHGYRGGGQNTGWRDGWSKQVMSCCLCWVGSPLFFTLKHMCCSENLDTHTHTRFWLIKEGCWFDSRLPQVCLGESGQSGLLPQLLRDEMCAFTMASVAHWCTGLHSGIIKKQREQRMMPLVCVLWWKGELCSVPTSLPVTAGTSAPPRPWFSCQ